MFSNGKQQNFPKNQPCGLHASSTLFLRHTQDTVETCKSLCGKAHHYRPATSTSPAISKEDITRYKQRDIYSVEYIAWAIPPCLLCLKGCQNKPPHWGRQSTPKTPNFYLIVVSMIWQIIFWVSYYTKSSTFLFVQLADKLLPQINVHGIELRHFSSICPSHQAHWPVSQHVCNLPILD